MKILYVANKPIFPIVDGGCKAMHQFLQCLIFNDYSIDHICLSTAKHPFNIDNYPTEILTKVPTKAFQINTDLKVSQGIKHLFTRESYNISRFDDEDVHLKLKETLIIGNYTHVILESLYLTPYTKTIKENSSAKIIIRTHNVEHTIWQQLAENSSNPIKKWYFRRLAADLKKYEKEILNNIDLIATISDEDLNEFKKLGINAEMVSIPVAMPQKPLETDYTTRSLFFLGSMNWKPNYEAVDWFCKEILPVLRLKIADIEFHLAGSYMGDKFKTDPEKGIVNHGFAQDSSDFMKKNGILVIPVRTGSGVRIKLLEAMSLGVPVVSTHVGTKGIDLTNEVKYAENVEEFVESLSLLIASEQEREKIGRNAYNFIEQNYSIPTISLKIDEAIK